MTALLAALVLTLASVGCVALIDGETRRALRVVLARRAPWFTPRILVIGDSLAACCPFGQLDRRPFAVLSLARGGATLKEIAGQAQSAFDIDADWIVADGGVNDLLSDGATPERVEEDFRALLRRLPQTRKIIFLLPPYVAQAAEGARIGETNRRVAALCAEAKVIALDLNPRLCDGETRRSEMTTDGLHFSRAANEVWLAAVAEAMRSSAGISRALSDRMDSFGR